MLDDESETSSSSTTVMDFLGKLDPEFLSKLATMDCFIENKDILSSVKEATSATEPIKSKVKSDTSYDGYNMVDAGLSGDTVNSLTSMPTELQGYFDTNTNFLYNIEKGTESIMSMASLFENLDDEHANQLSQLFNTTTGEFSLSKLDRGTFSDFYSSFTMTVQDMLDPNNWNLSDNSYIRVNKGGKIIGPLALDQYVMGVCLGEYVAQAYTQSINGTKYQDIGGTYESGILALQSFAIWARSFGLRQTVFNDKYGHSTDRLIEAGTSKQCFRYDWEKVFNENPEAVLMAFIAAKTTEGQVLVNSSDPSQPYGTQYTNKSSLYCGNGKGGQMALLRLANEDTTQDPAVLAQYAYGNNTLIGYVDYDATSRDELLKVNQKYYTSET